MAHRLRLPALLLLSGSLLAALVASDAHAYRMWLEADLDVDTMQVGDRVSVSLHLDTEGASDIVLLSIGTFFDPTIVSYDESASSVAEYVLYDPGTDAKSDPATWLQSTFDAPQIFLVNPRQVNVDLILNILIPPPDTLGTKAVDDDVVLAIMVFEQIAEGEAGFLLAQGGGNVFSTKDALFPGLLGTDLVSLGDPIGTTDDGWVPYQLPNGCLLDPRTDEQICPGDPEDPGSPDDGTNGTGGGGDDGTTGTGGGGDDGTTGTGGGGTGTTGGGGEGPVQAVPEPGAGMLFAAGLLLVRGHLRRGQRARA